MRRILGLCVVLAVSTAPAYAWQNPGVGTPIPNIHAPAAPEITPSSVLQGTTTTTAPATVQTPGTMVATQPGASVATPGTMVTTQPGTVMTTPMASTTPTYYYRTGLFGRRYRVAAPNYTYTANTTPMTTAPVQTYTTPVRRRWPFNMFQRRVNQPMAPYATTYYTTPGYYTTGNYAPVAYSNAAPTQGTVATAPTGTTTPAYTPTSYNVPTTGTTPATPVPTNEAFPPIIPNRLGPK